METVTFFDFEQIDRKIRTLEAKTDEIHELRQQMQKQNDLINELKNNQTFADNMTDKYTQEQIMSLMQGQIDELKKRLDMNNQK